jgi:hypothetical protein
MEYVMHSYFVKPPVSEQMPSDEETKLDAINRLASQEQIEYKYLSTLEHNGFVIRPMQAVLINKKSL